MVEPVSRVKMTHPEEGEDSEQAVSSVESQQMASTFSQHAKRVQLDYGPSDLKHEIFSSGVASSNDPPGAEDSCRAKSHQLNCEPFNVPPKSSFPTKRNIYDTIFKIKNRQRKAAAGLI